MRKTRFTQWIVLACMGALAACTSSGEGGTVGNTELNIVVPNNSPDLVEPPDQPQSGPDAIDIQSIEYTINCTGTAQDILGTPLPNGGAVQVNGNLEVVDLRTDPQGPIPPEFGTPRPGDGAEIWQAFMDLPPGPCTIELRARDNDGEVICTATEQFDITADRTNKVNLVLICDLSVQAPVGSLDVDATFSFVVGNFCPDLIVINCVNQDEAASVQPFPLGGECSLASNTPGAPCATDADCTNGTCDGYFIAASGCQVRSRDVDGNCGTSCDPQACFDDGAGLLCSQPGGPDIIITGGAGCDPPGGSPTDPSCIYDAPPDPGLTTTVSCTTGVTAIPGIPVFAVDCDINGTPDTVDVCQGSGNAGAPCTANADCPGGTCDTVPGCTYTGNQLGDVGQQLPGPLDPGDGGFVVAHTLCTQGIIAATGGALPQCDDVGEVGNPIYSSATATCNAHLSDGDLDCDKDKQTSSTGPGDSPCVVAGCSPGIDCTLCNDGNICTSDVCDDSTGTAECPNGPLDQGTDCSDDFGGASAECNGAGQCILLGCVGDPDCPGPDGNCLGQSTCQSDLTCSAQPAVNPGGACDNSGIGSGSGTCSGTTCASNDACGVPGTPACPDTNECNLGFCDTALTPYACGIDPTLANGNSCNAGAGVCSNGSCVLPPIVDECNGLQNSTIGCLVTGNLDVPLDVSLNLSVSSAGGGADVEFDYFLSAVNPTFNLAGVAADTAILNLDIFTDVGGGTPVSVSSVIEPSVPDQELSAFLADPTPLPPGVANEIILAVNPGGIQNVCGLIINSTCTQGPIPQGVLLASENIIPGAVGEDTTYGWSADLSLTISALGGALILDVNTSDPNVCGPACDGGAGDCAPLVQGAPISCGSIASP